MGAAKWSRPVPHRIAVTAADAADPTDSLGAIDCGEYEQARFDIVKNSGTVTALEVQLLFWNAKQGAFMRGTKLAVDELPKALVTEVRGATVFLKVTTLTGTNPNISVDYAVS